MLREPCMMSLGLETSLTQNSNMTNDGTHHGKETVCKEYDDGHPDLQIENCVR